LGKARGALRDLGKKFSAENMGLVKKIIQLSEIHRAGEKEYSSRITLYVDVFVYIWFIFCVS